MRLETIPVSAILRLCVHAKKTDDKGRKFFVEGENHIECPYQDAIVVRAWLDGDDRNREEVVKKERHYREYVDNVL